MTFGEELCQAARNVLRDAIASAVRLARRHGTRHDLMQIAALCECEAVLIRQELRESGKTYPQCEED